MKSLSFLSLASKVKAKQNEISSCKLIATCSKDSFETYFKQNLVTSFD